MFKILLLITALFTACVTAPETGRKQMIFMPVTQMHAMGGSAYDDILKKEKKSADRQLTAAVVGIGKRIAKASGADYKWEFNLFENKQVNAFCLPGGKVGVYTGIIPVAKTNAGLAAVLGHEVAHATARHGAERVSQTMVAAGTVMAADQALKTNKHRGELMAALGLGVQFGVLLPYSRTHESEADEIGLIYMAKAGYDPREAPALWRRMAKAGGGGAPEWLSTHPDPLKRAKALEKLLPKVMGYYNQSQKQPTRAL